MVASTPNDSQDPTPRVILPDLAGRVAVVTGAARGMGASHVRALVAAGVRVIGADLDAETMARTAEDIGGIDRVLGVQADVAVRADHARLADLALERFGRLDYWVNNAGFFPSAAVLDIDETQLETTFRVNVDAHVFGAQAAAAAMGAGGGAIVNILSMSAFRVRPPRAVYSASKAAADHMMRFLAVELAPRGIRVNGVAPGFIDTGMTAWVRDQPGALDAATSSIPLGRIGRPDEVSNAVLFLLSDAASYITGTTLLVDGGALAFTP
jgi:3-oxoacyl-[acyl-carrier protein] reductase